MPLRILRLRGLIGSSAVRGFLVTGMFTTFFLGALYLQHVLHYSAVQTGVAFLPMTLTVATLSLLGIPARLVARFGAMRVLIPGLLCGVASLDPPLDRRRRCRLLPDDLPRLPPARVRAPEARSCRS